MSGLQSKISRHTKKQKNTAHKEKKSQSKMTQTDTNARINRGCQKHLLSCIPHVQKFN